MSSNIFHISRSTNGLKVRTSPLVLNLVFWNYQFNFFLITLAMFIKKTIVYKILLNRFTKRTKSFQVGAGDADAAAVEISSQRQTKKSLFLWRT